VITLPAAPTFDITNYLNGGAIEAPDPKWADAGTPPTTPGHPQSTAAASPPIGLWPSLKNFSFSDDKPSVDHYKATPADSSFTLKFPANIGVLGVPGGVLSGQVGGRNRAGPMGSVTSSKR
jgi:hypothetical protein